MVFRAALREEVESPELGAARRRLRRGKASPPSLPWPPSLWLVERAAYCVRVPAHALEAALATRTG